MDLWSLLPQPQRSPETQVRACPYSPRYQTKTTQVRFLAGLRSCSLPAHPSTVHLTGACFLVCLYFNGSFIYLLVLLPGWHGDKASPANFRRGKFDPWGRSQEEEMTTSSSNFCLENPMDIGAWRARVQRAEKTRRWLNAKYTHCLWNLSPSTRDWTQWLLQRKSVVLTTALPRSCSCMPFQFQKTSNSQSTHFLLSPWITNASLPFLCLKSNRLLKKNCNIGQEKVLGSSSEQQHLPLNSMHISYFFKKKIIIFVWYSIQCIFFFDMSVA